MTKTFYYSSVALILSLVGLFASVASAFDLTGTPPIPEVTGIPAYVSAVAIGQALTAVTAEKTGRTFEPVITKNISGATYTVTLVEKGE